MARPKKYQRRRARGDELARERKTGYPTRAQHNDWERKWRAEKKAQGLVMRQVKGHWIWVKRKAKKK